MTSLLSSACVLLAVILMLRPAAPASTRRCHSIYKGFAQCLMALGDSLTDSARKDEDMHEIHSICRSWDQFHDCANLAMAGCPEEAAAVWESLRQESKKMQFSGNLYDMCSRRDSYTVAPAPPQGNVNQESLRGRGVRPWPRLLPLLLLLLPPFLI
ncbi:neuritin 1-like a [Synchiropus splendidus]|uniref:neuritin 1-like a n=1 Tax=Synchiropus splendidus TaxID=270530 RepID=UPI00237D4F49|nr:neuritin 1-like a [Synchiropus splendidus]